MINVDIIANTREGVKHYFVDFFIVKSEKKVLLKRRLFVSSLSVSPAPVCGLSLLSSPPITLEMLLTSTYLGDLHLGVATKCLFPQKFSICATDQFLFLHLHISLR